MIPARETAWYKKCTVKIAPIITSNSGNCKYQLKWFETVRSLNYCSQSEITVRSIIQLYVAVKAIHFMSVDDPFPTRQRNFGNQRC